MEKEISEQIIEDDINAAATIIADISTGLYRSPASAIKELVSNSFDAGATEVVITSGYPDFRVLTCSDNGEGISVEDFREIMRYIGGSLKREAGDVGPFGRPIIGKIGIGILALAQIKDRFTVVSSRAGEPTKFEAEIDLRPFQKKGAARAGLGQGTIGRYRLTVLPEDKDKQYTIISTDDVKRGFRETLADQHGLDLRRKEVKADTFREFVEQVNRTRLHELNEYSEMLWELAVLAPVAYFDDGPVRGWQGWESVRQQLNSYNFKLIVDGYELRKPILLPSDPDIQVVPEDYKVYEFSFDETGAGKRLRFIGYIYHQRKQLLPPEMQGILIRIRNVGIGLFDKSFLGYPMSVGPMLRGMCGEVYVLDGLEGALNIDRNSFRETDEHYRALQTKLFQTLGEPRKAGLTRDIRERSAARMEKQREAETIENYRGFCAKVAKLIGRPLELHVSHETAEFPLKVDLKAGMVTAYQGHALFPKNPKERLNLFRFLLAYELSHCMESQPDSQKKRMYELLRRR